MPDDPRLTAELLARDTLAHKTWLDESWGKQWQEVLNDSGSGKLMLQNDDPDLALVEYGDYVRFSIDGTARFAIIVESIERTDIAPAEEVDEATVISGRGAVAVLENAVVYPDALFVEGVPFADARVFNFGSLLPSGPGSWVTAYDWGDRFSAGPVFTDKPADFPPVATRWVGPEAPDGGGDNPPGDWYYFALFAAATPARYRLYFGYDDRIEIWIDNVPIFASEETTIDAVKSVDVYLDGIIHYLGFKITNNVFGGVNPTGLTAALCLLNPDDTVASEIWNTDPSDPNQFAMAYPSSPPGYTPGSIIHQLYLEATGSRDVGSVGLVTPTFDGTVDSNGDAWTEYISPSVNIGTDLFTFMKALAESSFDFWFNPVTWELNLYQSFGAATGVTYARAANLTDLRHSGKF